ncbi:prepilin-type N-terminal cleavage/methylation domain-containing protein [Alicyclobacillus macrosporangiidus]|uniref:prepilin-type N-terminal cleavage/methylation domain-containing protein n=1 Tax=Alicyclobacillus macrosporangiidus TaxID=392015 RepID=UPI0022AE8CBE|nr:prepilin-type N-terminal cleavage/methylation domain-containing protein [Alicyclobacillus macrosporangiidus]
MDHANTATAGAGDSHAKPAVSLLNYPPKTRSPVSPRSSSESGLTLVELLAALALTGILAGGVLAAYFFEQRTLPWLEARQVVQTGLVSIDKQLRETFQNVSAVTSAGPSELTCETADGGTVEVYVKQVDVVDGMDVCGLEVKTNSSTGQSKDVVWRLPMVSLAGTQFQVQGSLVTVTLQGTYLGQPISRQLTSTYVVGGGN